MFCFQAISQNTVGSVTAASESLPSSSVCWHPCNRPDMTLTARSFATLSTQQPGSLPEYQIDPYHLLEDDLKDVYTYIRQVCFFSFSCTLLLRLMFMINERLHYYAKQMYNYGEI